RRCMVEYVRRHRAHDGDVIDDTGCMRQTLRYPRPCLTVPRELSPRSQQLWLFLGEEAVHEGEAFAFDELVGNGFAVQGREFRLVIEQLKLTGATGHEQKDDVFGFGRKMGLLRR